MIVWSSLNKSKYYLEKLTSSLTCFYYLNYARKIIVSPYTLRDEIKDSGKEKWDEEKKFEDFFWKRNV